MYFKIDTIIVSIKILYNYLINLVSFENLPLVINNFYISERGISLRFLTLTNFLRKPPIPFQETPTKNESAKAETANICETKWQPSGEGSRCVCLRMSWAYKMLTVNKLLAKWWWCLKVGR